MASKARRGRVFTYRLAQQLVAKGWSVEWCSASYAGAAAHETRDGIVFVRIGSQMTVHAAAFLRYRRSSAFDVIVDEINTIPFYAGAYGAGIPVVTLMFQLAREVWLQEGPPGLAQIGYVLEPLYLQPYRDALIATIAPSTVESFRKYGLRGDIRVLPIAVDEPVDASVPQKDPGRDIIVLGRVAPSKRIDDAIRAASVLASRGWAGKLHIVGTGDPLYAKRLRRLGAALAIEDHVFFHGRVTDAERLDLLRRCSALWMTSFREGWGLVVTEAARHGTPSVVYGVSGLRDAVVDGKTGYVVRPAPEALAAATLKLFSGDYYGFALRALAHSSQYSWENTAAIFEALLLEVIARAGSRRETSLIQRVAKHDANDEYAEHR